MPIELVVIDAGSGELPALIHIGPGRGGVGVARLTAFDLPQ